MAILFCPNCGRESNGEKFCPECGTNLSPDQQSDNNLSSPDKKKKSKRLIISLVLILAVLAGAAIYFLTKDSASAYIERACISMSNFDPYTKGGDERLLKAKSLQRAIREDIEEARRIDSTLALESSRAFATLDEYVKSLQKWDSYFNLYVKSDDFSYLALAISEETSYKTLALSFKSQADSACR